MKHKMILFDILLSVAWFVLLNVVKRSLRATWIYEMHNAALNLCHGLTIYEQKENIFPFMFYCVAALWRSGYTIECGSQSDC